MRMVRVVCSIALLAGVATSSSLTEDAAENDYATYRKGEFLAMQYERAVQLEAEGMKMAAEGRFEDANEKLVICVVMHQQLLGQRHPQLIRPYLAAAENSAKWGDSLGLQGKEQVKKAQEYVDNALLILDSMPLSSKELMGEEELRLVDMKTVLAQMLDALSPPEELVASSRRGPILLPELPEAVNLLEEGNTVYLNLTREHPWAFHAATVKEGWMHAQTLVGRDSKMMVYGIQTVTTAMAVTQDARLRLHAVIAASADTGSGGAGWTHGDGSRERCRWWNDAQCLEGLSAGDFAMSGDQGVGLGRDSMTKGPAPAWMHFMELPSDVGSVALLGAEMDPPSQPPLGLALLTVNEEPMVPLHLGDGLQTWELDGFRASVHYLTWTEETQLHRLKIADKACRMMSDARVLFSWGSIPMTTLANVRSAQACLHTQGLTTEFLPSGCWRNGAKDGDMLFVVIINPCSAPSTITMSAEFHTQGGAPAASRPSPREAAGPEPPGNARHSKPHAQALEISARQHYAMQLHGQGVFVRAPEPQPLHGWLSMLRQLLTRAWKSVRQVGLLGAAVVLAMLSAMVLAGRASLRRKAKPGALRPPSQRGGGSRSSNQQSSSSTQPHRGHERPWWLRWLPTLSELSGTRPKARQDPAGAETTYEINIRRGRVSVSAVQQRRPSTANSNSPRRSSPSPGQHQHQHHQQGGPTTTAVQQRQESTQPLREGSEDTTRGSAAITSNTIRSRAHRGIGRAAGSRSRSQGNSPSSSTRESRERITSMPSSPAASSPAASPLRPPQRPHDPPELSALAQQLLGSPVSSVVNNFEDDEEPLPDMYNCPITQEVMRDPVFATDGYTYEREAIEDWLKVKRTSPMTNLPFDSPILVPNNALRSAILEAVERRGRMHIMG